jgi:hypothetical protein
MFCEDSRGTDIDHFWPISPYSQFVFLWANLLWACSGCNRCKSDSFPLDLEGHPLLINPITDDPWDHFFYDTETDELAARWISGGKVEDEKALYTLNVLSTLRHEAVAEGRKRVRRNLIRSVNFFLNGARQGTDQAELLAELLESIDDNDGFGLLQWFFLREGREDKPFSWLQEGHPEIWTEVTKHIQTHGHRCD